MHTVLRRNPPSFDRIIAMIADEGIDCIPSWVRLLAWFVGGLAGSPQRFLSPQFVSFLSWFSDVFMTPSSNLFISPPPPSSSPELEGGYSVADPH